MNISIALKTLNKEDSKDTWKLFDKAILNVQNDNFDNAKNIFNEIHNKECEYDYEFERKQVIHDILMNSNTDSLLLEKIKSLIIRTREQKKLPTITMDELY